MKMWFLLIMIVLQSCGSSKPEEKVRIGIDEAWSLQNFGQQIPYVNGFIEDLLLRISKEHHLHIEKIPTGGDELFQGLQNGFYDAVLSGMPQYSFNLAKYDFSENFLPLGPVFIVHKNSKKKDLEDLDYEAVGVILGDSSATLLRKYPKIIIKEFADIPEMLNQIVSDNLAGALVGVLPASSFVSDLYQKELEIVGKPLNEEGLHFVMKKEQNTDLIKMFDDVISDTDFMKKSSKKWGFL